MAIASVIRVNNNQWSWKRREGLLLSSPSSHRQTPINLLCFSKSSKFTCAAFASSRSQLSNSSVAVRNQKDTLSPSLERAQSKQHSSTLLGIASCDALKSIMKHQAAALLLFGLLLIKANCPCYPALALSRPAVGFNSSSSSTSTTSTCYNDEDNENDRWIKTKNQIFLWSLFFCLPIFVFGSFTTVLNIQVGFHGPVHSLREDLDKINRQAKAIRGTEAFRRALSCLLQYSEYSIYCCFSVDVDGNPIAAGNRYDKIVEKENQKFESVKQASAGNSKIKSHTADHYEYMVVTITAVLGGVYRELKNINDSRCLNEALQKLLLISEIYVMNYSCMDVKLCKEELDMPCLQYLRPHEAEKCVTKAF